MGIDIGGSTTITQASSVLTIDTGVPMRLLSAGPVSRPNQCQFIAVSDPSFGWVNLGNTWNKIGTFTSTKVNTNGCFSLTETRFTAPVDGMYFFQVTGAHLLKDGAHPSYYWHPVFGINGDVAGRVAGGNVNYRIRGHGVSIASYDDGSINQIYKLIAGDYVEPYLFSNGSPLNRYHAPYWQWSGFLLG